MRVGRTKKLLVVAALVGFVLLLKINNWLTTYQAVAIWLEGIALVLIFVWDRFDARDALEATHRPFVSYSSILRPAEDVMVDADNKYATTEIYCEDKQAQLKNYGSGPAINLHYVLRPTNPASSVSRPEGYMVALRTDFDFVSPVPCDLLKGEWETVITYESLSGRKYQTKIISNDLVLTNISVTKL
jgi:hypothetical protein